MKIYWDYISFDIKRLKVESYRSLNKKLSYSIHHFPFSIISLIEIYTKAVCLLLVC